MRTDPKSLDIFGFFLERSKTKTLDFIMRTFLVILVTLLLLGLGYIGFAHFSGASVPTFGLPIGGERAQVRARTLSFFEHVKFKNASALQDFVESEVDRHEMGEYLLKSLGINPQNIDLVGVAIESVELNTTETRARARVSFSGQNLDEKKPFSFSKIIFLYKNTENIWLIDTKSVAP